MFGILTTGEKLPDYFDILQSYEDPFPLPNTQGKFFSSSLSFLRIFPIFLPLCKK